MKGNVWILDEHEDNLGLIAEGLAMAGVTSMEFSSPGAFLSRAAQSADDLPFIAVVDAWTALGREREIRDAVRSRLIVLTTWPGQLAAWLSLGASRFLLKPFGIETLVEHVAEGYLARARSVVKARLVTRFANVA